MNWIDVNVELPDKEIVEAGIDMNSYQVIIQVILTDEYYKRMGLQLSGRIPQVTTGFMQDGEWYWHENRKKMSVDFKVIKWMWLPSFEENL